MYVRHVAICWCVTGWTTTNPVIGLLRQDMNGMTNQAYAFHMHPGPAVSKPAVLRWKAVKVPPFPHLFALLRVVPPTLRVLGVP